MATCMNTSSARTHAYIKIPSVINVQTGTVIPACLNKDGYLLKTRATTIPPTIPQELKMIPRLAKKSVLSIPNG